MFNYKTCFIENENTISRLCNSVKYIFIVELFAYIYHRIVHTKILLNLHSHNYIGTTYHYLLRSKYDILAQIIYIYYPLFIVNMTYNDFIIIYFIYIFTGFISSTTNFYKIHRHSKKYNYSLALPLFDIFGTYLSEETFSSIYETNL